MVFSTFLDKNDSDDDEDKDDDEIDDKDDENEDEDDTGDDKLRRSGTTTISLSCNGDDNKPLYKEIVICLFSSLHFARFDARNLTIPSALSFKRFPAPACWLCFVASESAISPATAQNIWSATN